MTKREPSHRTRLEVDVMFEPNRMAAVHLKDAYGRLVPSRVPWPRMRVQAKPRAQSAEPRELVTLGRAA